MVVTCPPEHIADLWINGHYFHDDSEKAQELRRYVPHNILFVRPEFLNFIVEATRVIGGYRVHRQDGTPRRRNSQLSPLQSRVPMFHGSANAL